MQVWAFTVEGGQEVTVLAKSLEGAVSAINNSSSGGSDVMKAELVVTVDIVGEDAC